jgi:TonB family protein
LILEEHLLDTARDEPDGRYREYYDNGQLRIDANYVMGKIEGKVVTYWENGQLKRSDLYQEGKYLKGTCYNKQGKPIPHFDYEKAPEFPGGERMMMAYMGSEIKYPKKARKNNIQGLEEIAFTVKKDGSISNIRIVQSVDPELAHEAIKMIKGMPRWKPGMRDGETTNFDYVLPVRFKLE